MSEILALIRDGVWAGLGAYVVYCIHSYSLHHLAITKRPMMERREKEFPWAQEKEVKREDV